MLLLFLLWCAEGPYDLPALLEAAEVQNADLRAHDHLAEAHRYHAEATDYLPDPTIQLGVYAQPVETRVGPQRFSIGASQSLPYFGERAAQRDKAEAEATEHHFARQHDWFKIRRDLTQVWFERAFLHQKRVITIENLNLVKQLEETARTRFRTNQSSYAFVVQTQTRLADLSEQIEAIGDDIAAIEARIRTLAGLEHHTELAPIQTIEAAPRSTFEVHPSEQQLAAQASILRKQEAVESFNLKPRFTFGLTYIETGNAIMPTPDSGKDPIIASVGVKVPLFKGATRARMARSRAQANAKEAQLTQLRRRINGARESQIALLRKAGRRVQLYEEVLIPQARDALEASLQALRTDEIDFLSVIDSQSQLLKHQLDLERARADVHIHIAELTYLGKHGHGKGDINHD